MTSFDRFEKENHISHLSRILIENETEILRVCHNNHVCYEVNYSFFIHVCSVEQKVVQVHT